MQEIQPNNDVAFLQYGVHPSLHDFVLQPIVRPFVHKMLRMRSSRISVTSMGLEVEDPQGESTAPSSSKDKLVDASVLLESVKVVSKNSFRAGCLLLDSDVGTCPLTFLMSAPSNSCIFPKES